MSRLFGMSLQIRERPSPKYTGPSHQRIPVASRSMLALNSRYRLKLGSRLLIAVPGWLCLGSQPPRALRVNVVRAAALVAANILRLVISMAYLPVAGHDRNASCPT